MDLVAYLAYDGRCEEAFKHYEKVLGGKMLMMMRMKDAPPGTPISPGSENRIMHARLEVPGGRLLMGGDAPSQFYSKPQGITISVQEKDVAEAERIFNELAQGGEVRMPLSETFWARRWGMLVDQFSIPWMINCERPIDVTETPSKKPFTISRTYDVPRDVLWDCFTDPARMQQWWGPKGVTVTHSKMDFKPSGRYHYCMRTPDGQEMWGRQVYREIKALERIVLVNAFSDAAGGLTRHPMAPQWPIEMLSTFTFTEAGPDKSTFTVHWTPIYPSSEELAAFEAGHASMTGGWTGTLDQLGAYLTSNA